MKVRLPPARILSLTIIPDYSKEKEGRGWEMKVAKGVRVRGQRIYTRGGPHCTTDPRNDGPCPRSSRVADAKRAQRGQLALTTGPAIEKNPNFLSCWNLL